MLSSVARQLTVTVPSLHPGVELGNSELTGKPGKNSEGRGGFNLQ